MRNKKKLQLWFIIRSLEWHPSFHIENLFMGRNFWNAFAVVARINYSNFSRRWLCKRESRSFSGIIPPTKNSRILVRLCSHYQTEKATHLSHVFVSCFPVIINSCIMIDMCNSQNVARQRTIASAITRKLPKWLWLTRNGVIDSSTS